MAAVSLPARARLAQVECNAPLSGVNIRTERAATAATTSDAAMAAEAHRARAVAQAKLRQEKAANFQRETVERLREKARARRAEQSQAVEETVREVSTAATNIITQRRDPPAEVKQQPKDDSETSGRAPASQLSRMRAGLIAQAGSARALMLGHCADVIGPEPSLASPLPDGPPLPAFEAALTAAPTLVTAESRCMLRAVVTSAARVDRENARQARREKERVTQKREQRAQLAEAMAQEREAALRAESLRMEVSGYSRLEAPPSSPLSSSTPHAPTAL